MQKKVPVYVLFVVIFFGAWVTVFYGGLIRHIYEGGDKFVALQKTAYKVASFPSLVKNVLTSLNEPPQGVVGDRFPQLSGFEKNGQIPEGVALDKGYVLISSYNTNKQKFTVQLIKVSNQKKIFEWDPNISELFSVAPLDNQKSVLLRPPEMTKETPLIPHSSLLLDDGSLVFLFYPNIGLYKVGLCSNLEWSLADEFHHSIELDSEGNLWVGSALEPSPYMDTGIYFRDDSITKISQNGEILFIKSVAKILEENGYRGLLLKELSTDPIHLNDIQPALTTSKFWHKGDLLLSLRHLNTIFLYRPSTDKIIWLKTGPWVNQHDADFVGESGISVFGNDIIIAPKISPKLHSVFNLKRVAVGEKIIEDSHNIYHYDFSKNSLTMPYSSVLKNMKVDGAGSGLTDILENGDAFVEETESGRLLRISPEKTKWEFVKRVDENHLSVFNWSRYLTSDQLQFVLPKLKSASCDK
jgi:hypothetical protein